MKRAYLYAALALGAFLLVKKAARAAPANSATKNGGGYLAPDMGVSDPSSWE